MSVYVKLVDFPSCDPYYGKQMKTATVRDLRTHFPQVEAWLNDGEDIQVTKHGRPIAWITAAHKHKPKKFKKPDFMARLKEIWGDKVFTEEEMRAIRNDSQGELYERLSGQ